MDNSGADPLRPSLEEWQEYERMFKEADRDGTGKISGGDSAPLMRHVTSDRLVLRVIWALVDSDKDGFIGVEEFCAGMHLAKSASLGNSLPSMVPEELLERPTAAASAGGKASDPSPNLSRRSSKESSGNSAVVEALELQIADLQREASSLAKQIGAKQAQIDEMELTIATLQAECEDQSEELAEARGARLELIEAEREAKQLRKRIAELEGTLQASPQGQGGGLGGVADTIPGKEWSSYKAMFIKADRDGDGFLDGGEAAPILQSVVSNRASLRSIWALADRDNDGQVSLGEFCVGMHLAKQVAQGASVPAVVPKKLMERMSAKE